jgi:competence protein ComEC
MPRPPDVAGGPDARRSDLRALVLGGSAWAGGLTALAAPGWTCLPVAGLAVGWTVHRARQGKRVATLLAALLAAGAVAASASVHVQLNRSSVVASLAEQRAAVRVTATVTGDPVQRSGRFGPYTLTRVRITEVEARGRRLRTGVPVLVIGDEPWGGVALGATVLATGRLAPAQGPDLAGVLTSRAPTVLSRPATVLTAAAAVRAGIRAAVVDAAPGARTLVPALVVGTTSRCPRTWWRTSGPAG